MTAIQTGSSNSYFIIAEGRRYAFGRLYPMEARATSTDNENNVSFMEEVISTSGLYGRHVFSTIESVTWYFSTMDFAIADYLSCYRPIYSITRMQLATLLFDSLNFKLLILPVYYPPYWIPECSCGHVKRSPDQICLTSIRCQSIWLTVRSCETRLYWPRLFRMRDIGGRSAFVSGEITWQEVVLTMSTKPHSFIWYGSRDPAIYFTVYRATASIPLPNML